MHPARRVESARAVRGRHEPLVLRVLLDVMRDERAERRDLETLPRRFLEHAGGEHGAEALAFTRLFDLRVRQDDASVAATVRGDADQAPAEPQFEAGCIRIAARR